MSHHLLTWILLSLLGHVFTGEELTLDCLALPRPTLVPVLDKTTDNTDSVSFSDDLTRLFEIFKTIDDPYFTTHPENKELIIPNSLDVCHYIGKPITWGKLPSVKPKGKYVSIMEGYFGRAEQVVKLTNGVEKLNLEVCQFDNTLTYGSAKCDEMLSEKQAENKLESSGYGGVTNKILVLGIRSNKSEWLEIGSDSDLPLACMATPLTKTLTELKLLSEEVYCSLDNMFDLLGGYL